MLKALYHRLGFRLTYAPRRQSTHRMLARFMPTHKSPLSQTKQSMMQYHYYANSDISLALQEFDIDRHRRKLETMKADMTAPEVQFLDMPFIFDENDNNQMKPVPCYISEDEIQSQAYPNILRDMRIMLMRQYLPNDKSEHYSTLFFFQGTGYIAREIAFTDTICRYLCHDSQCQVILIPYPLAPEKKWPAAKDGANMLLDYLYKNSEDFKINLNHVSFVSYSSGTAIAIHAAYHWLYHEREIKKQYLVCPFVDFARIQKGFEHNENQDKVISENFVKITIELSVPADKNRQDSDLSPLYADPSILPPSYIVTGENDRTRGDAEKYADKLMHKGVEVEKRVISGQNHSLGWQNMTIWRNIAQDVKQTMSPHADHTSAPTLG